MVARSERIATVVGSLVVAGSVVLAITLHRNLVRCSYNTTVAPPCAHTTDYPLILRETIIVAGLAVSTILLVAVRFFERRGH